jgi:hypothetical protein
MMLTRFGWVRRLMAMASRSNRVRFCGRRADVRCKNFTATALPSPIRSARYTTPMPPAASRPSIR